MTALSNQGLNLHVTHSCRFTVEKRLWRHPLNWETRLKKKNYRFIPKNQRTSKANEQRGANDLAPVVQRLDNAIHRINHYPADKC